MAIRKLYGSPWATAVVFVSVAALTLGYYNWLARASGTQYQWTQDLPGYYDYLGRAFAGGQLHLPVTPRPELLALKDPWDPALNEQWRLHDAALYKKRYYLYHGAAPAVLLFAPWRMLTGYDLAENFAAMLLCFLGYVFLSGSAVMLLKQAGALPGPSLLAPMLVVLAVGTGVPYLLVRVSMYEIAIAGAYFGAAGGLFFFVLGIHTRRTVLLFASGLLLGVALSSRPHVGLAGGICFLLVLAWNRRWSGAVALGVPFVLCGLAILAYNYARFDNALEFGVRYLLAGERNQQRLNVSVDNLYPGAFYMLLCPPFLSAVFPFVRLLSRIPPLTGSLPNGYFFEPTAGALLLAPVLAALVLVPMLRHDRSAAGVVLAALGTAFGAFLFVIATGFTTQRYQVDFVPLMLFAALVCIGMAAHRWRGGQRSLMLAMCACLCTWTILANAALGMTGPYDDILQSRPASWIRIAQWFRFADNHTPVLNPAVSIAARVAFDKRDAGFLEPLIVLGYQAHRWMLYAEHTQNGVLLISASNGGSVRPETFLQPGRQMTVSATYDPPSRVMTTLVDGQPYLRHELTGLALARSQVQLGRNDTVRFFTYPTFTGSMQVAQCLISP